MVNYRKNNSSWIVLFFSIACLCGANACTFQYPEITTIQEVKILGLKDKTLQIELKAGIYNPNSYQLELEKIFSKTFINGLLVADAESKQDVTLNASDTTYVIFQTDLSIETLAQIYPYLLKDDFCEMKIQSRSLLKTAYGTQESQSENFKKIDLHQYREQIMQRSLEMNALQIKAFQTEIKDEALNLKIVALFKNPYPFAFEIQAIAVDIKTTHGTMLAHWKDNTSRQIQAQKEINIPINISIETKDLLIALPELYYDKDKKMIAKGFCQVNIAGHVFKVPVEYTIPMPQMQL
ncbi:MAG: hypothetical protein EAZ55_09345 [Cytophagales bacterium]|nr:MAG: hypothetical protein EAZ55_09345 [Cytophagales bacterium]